MCTPGFDDSQYVSPSDKISTKRRVKRQKVSIEIPENLRETHKISIRRHFEPSIRKVWPDMEFVQKFTPPDFKVENFTQSIAPYFNSFSGKNTKNA